ncbi:hypothetical protein GCM10010218_21420 [Streptomyces mashuensis]|uniref:Uncharacterized protein n=1 Tax=Streptomyces mashuensis TaxID=33904 RepID=A0A919B109_9ACTN|nr:hypothetical protein [Streptomyces mashuensis]GHF39802.1 hypothetical protein GCM10010218_21420 [Streptomyces mashuensis]
MSTVTGVRAPGVRATGVRRGLATLLARFAPCDPPKTPEHPKDTPDHHPADKEKA